MDSFTLQRTGDFLLGCNYWPRQTGPRMWRDFEPAQIAAELDLLREGGLDTIRAFCFWPDFMPTPERVEPVMLARLAEFMELCAARDLGVYLTPIVGHMSGENWPPVWLEDSTRLYDDERLLQIQVHYVAEVAVCVASSPALRGYILTNEMPLFAGSGELQHVEPWARRLYDAVRAVDADHPISLGDGVWSLWGEDTGFRPSHKQDFLGLHLYPGETDALRHTFLFGLNVRMAAMSGKPVLMEEFGAQHTVFGEAEIGAFARSVIYESWVNGATGALWWCGFDFPLPDDLPYSHHGFELRFGMRDVDGRAKPTADAFAAFARALPRIDGLSAKRAQVGYLIPSFLNTRYPFSWDDLTGMKHGHLQAYTLARLAGADIATLLEPPHTRESPSSATLRLPSPKEMPVLYVGAAQKLRTASWREIERWVNEGGTLVMSFDLGANETHVGTWHADFASFFGIRPRLRFGLTEPAATRLRLTRDLGALCSGTSQPLPVNQNAWHATPLLGETIDAEVYAVDEHDRPCLWRTRRGVGTIWLFGSPVEHARDWTNDAYVARTTLLREIFTQAGIMLLEAQPLGVVGCGDVERRMWMNHAWEPCVITLPPGRWCDLEGTMHVATAPLAAKSFDVFTRSTEV